MSNLVYTCFQNDIKLLRVWIDYYSKFFDRIHILCFGTKQEYLDELDIKGIEYEVIADENLKDEEIMKSLQPEIAINLVKEKQIEFLKDNIWVLYCNIDEFLVTSKRYKDLKDLMANLKKDYINCLAYDVIKVDGEGIIDYTTPILNQRKFWVKNENYNKIILSKIPLSWNSGSHQIANVSDNESKVFKNKGLYLVHLKHIDPDRKDSDLGPHYSKIETNNYPKDHPSLRYIPKWIKKF